LVRETCLCILIFNPVGKSFDEDWNGCKTMLTEMTLLDKMKDYKKDKIKES